MYAELDVTSAFTIGLRLPDGTVIYPPNDWHGRRIDTPSDRAIVLSALQDSARNMGEPEAQLLSRYKWVAVENQVLTVTRVLDSVVHDIDDPTLVEWAVMMDPEVEVEDLDQDVDDANEMRGT